MRDELVSFGTARLAKEKGFNIPQVKGYYTHGDIQLVLWVDSEDYNNQKDFLGYAPTQSLLAKWFREVHDIEIHISCVTQHNEVKKTCKLVHYQYFVKSKSQYYFIRIENEGFKTYELALEDALLESLKLIK